MRKTGRCLVATYVTMYGVQGTLVCDGRCMKAWGINNRPKKQLSDHEDDYVFLADGVLGVAPADPGTAEGGDSKPTTIDERLNRWCARECERSVFIRDFVPPNEARRRLPDMRKPEPNMRKP